MNLWKKSGGDAGNPPNEQSHMLIRALAGGYLIYLAYSIVSDGGLKENTGWPLVGMVAGLIAFVFFGLLFLWQGLKSLKTTPCDTDSEETDGEDGEESE